MMTDCPFLPYRYHYLLASQSARRSELMSLLGLDFEVVSTDPVEELYPDGLEGGAVPEYLARLKSSAYHAPVPQGSVLVTADTIVAAGSEVLGKPASPEDARRMLRLLSGRTHQVYSGVCLRTARSTASFNDVTHVTFRSMTDEEIDFYISRFRPFDKAGAYGIQEWIGYVAASRLDGSFYNVMGLPVQQLYEHLTTFLTHEQND